MRFESDTILYHVIGANIKHYREQKKINTGTTCRTGKNQYQLSI